jgi:LysR family transcriptional activator of nhaA
MPHLNYNHLRYFWVVAHEGGLNRAAERLNLSQSALSIQLKKLEEQVGHRLFERAGKRLTLTEAGRIALDYADTVFKAGDEMMMTLAGRPSTERQALRVGAVTTLSRNFQLQFLKPLIDRADVELIVRSGLMRDLLAQLDSHTLDVVLANDSAPSDAMARFRTHLLDAQPVSLVGRPLRKGKRLKFPDDLTEIPVLLPTVDSGMRLAFDRSMEMAGIRPIVHAEVDDMAMLRLLAREREGLTLVPPIVVRGELDAGVLVEHYRLPDVEERFYAIVPKRRFPNPLLSAVLARAAPGETA